MEPGEFKLCPYCYRMAISKKARIKLNPMKRAALSKHRLEKHPDNSRAEKNIVLTKVPGVFTWRVVS
jgi:hypothetical protein